MVYSDRYSRRFRPGLSMRVSTLQWRIALAFLSIYTIWGSTYLAIRFAVETFPPFLMAAVRFLIAGGVLYAWTRLRGALVQRALIGRPRLLSEDYCCS